MKVQELVNQLSTLPGGAKIMILDGFNGGGYPRDINVGPMPLTITADHADQCADCEEREDETVFVIGYGCY